VTDFLVVYEGDLHARVSTEDEATIDAAVRRQITTGQDELLVLTGVDGQPYKVRASRITGWTASTEDTRRFNRELDVELKQERPAWDRDD